MVPSQHAESALVASIKRHGRLSINFFHLRITLVDKASTRVISCFMGVSLEPGYLLQSIARYVTVRYSTYLLIVFIRNVEETQMKARRLAISTLLALTVVHSGVANASETDVASSPAGEKEWTKTAKATFPSSSSKTGSSLGPQPYFATNSALAPGGGGAITNVEVRGKSTFVDTVAVSYTRGIDYKQNICGVEHEIDYVEANGQHKTKSSKTPCSIGGSWAWFTVKNDLKDRSQVCGRSKVGGEWSNKACITIKK